MYWIAGFVRRNTIKHVVLWLIFAKFSAVTLQQPWQTWDQLSGAMLVFMWQTDLWGSILPITDLIWNPNVIRINMYISCLIRSRLHKYQSGFICFKHTHKHSFARYSESLIFNNSVREIERNRGNNTHYTRNCFLRHAWRMQTSNSLRSSLLWYLLT